VTRAAINSPILPPNLDALQLQHARLGIHQYGHHGEPEGSINFVVGRTIFAKPARSAQTIGGKTNGRAAAQSPSSNLQTGREPENDVKALAGAGHRGGETASLQALDSPVTFVATRMVSSKAKG